jgi:hypothetical protein
MYFPGAHVFAKSEKLALAHALNDTDCLDRRLDYERLLSLYRVTILAILQRVIRDTFTKHLGLKTSLDKMK